jgi:hypothetical protein
MGLDHPKSRLKPLAFFRDISESKKLFMGCAAPLIPTTGDSSDGNPDISKRSRCFTDSALGQLLHISDFGTQGMNQSAWQGRKSRAHVRQEQEIFFFL